MKYILDTNVLLNRPDFVRDNQVILIPHILRELEQLELKRTNYDMQYRIREAKRVINEHYENVEFLEDNDYKILTNNMLGYESDYVDNILLSYILLLEETGDLSDVCVYTDDVLLKIKLKARNIEVVDSRTMYDDEEGYSGIHTWCYDKHNMEHQEILSKIYSNQLTDNIFELSINEYLLIVDKDLELGEEIPIDIFVYKGNGQYYTIMNKLQTINSVHDDGEVIKPKNIRQKIAIDALNDKDSKVKIIKGMVGSGKTLLCFAKAKEMLDKELVNKIIWIGNPVLSKGTSDIGYRKGDTLDKLSASYAVIGDILGSNFLMDLLIDTEKLCVEFVGDLRSRSLDNAAIVVTESQNYTLDQLKLIITRVAEGSYLIMDGDYNQVDINNSGFQEFTSKLKDSDIVSIATLNNVERSEIAELAELL